MATRRDDALASVLNERSSSLDIVADVESLAVQGRPLNRFARPLVALLVASLAVSVLLSAVLVWSRQPYLAGGAVALLALGSAAGGICWRLGLAKAHAEAANAAKTRLLTALGEDLSKPLRAIARAGAAIDRRGLDPDEWGKIARMRLDARAMLLQLED